MEANYIKVKSKKIGGNESKRNEIGCPKTAEV